MSGRMMTEETDELLRAMKVSTESNVRKLSPAAKRALAEAEERREAKEAFKIDPESLATEYEGRKSGVEPVRYGDWEKDGIVSDF